MSEQTKTEKAPLTKEDKRNRVILAILSSIIILLILGGFIFGSPYSIKKNNYSSFESMIEEHYDRPTVVYATRPGCPNCDKVTPIISQLKDKYEDKVNFYCVDVWDKGEGSAFWDKYQPADVPGNKDGVPCVLYFYARKSPTDEIKYSSRPWGVNSIGDLEKMSKKVESLIANPYYVYG